MSNWHYERDGLTIYASLNGSRGAIIWKGVSDTRSPSAFIGPIAEELAKHLKGAEVTVDFTQLQYMNSATVGPMVSLIKNLDASSETVLVLFSQEDWQRTHLNCMTAIARTLQHVRVEGRLEP